MDKIKVLIIELDNINRKEISKILLNVEYISLVGETDAFSEGEALLESKTIDVILIGAQVEGNGYEIAEKIYTLYPEIAIIMLENTLHEETLRKAVFSGAKDVLIYPLVAAKIIDSIYKANQHMKNHAITHKDNYSKVKRKAGLGQVYTIFGTKGGVGRTFIAINLAVSIAKMTGKKVALIDLDLEFGDIALSMNVTPKFTIADIIDDIRNIDQDLIESYLLTHSSGVRILPSNSHPMMNDFINSEDIDIIIRTVQNAFDYVVIDMPSRFVETVQPAFAIADKLILVTSPEVASLRNVKTALISLNELNYPKTKIKVILNKVSKSDTIKKKDVETTLNIDVIGSVVSDYKLVSTSLNTGIPLVETKSSGAIIKDFENLVKRITDHAESIKYK